jgi:CubicO group peptidase (beta-lactamase class C family)
MSLRDPISNWMPEFKEMKVLVEHRDERGRTSREAVPARRPITVQDLLRHTSGFTYAGSAPFPELKEAYEKADWASPCGVEGSVRNPSTPGGWNDPETNPTAVYP